jgi:hypothetical protein
MPSDNQAPFAHQVLLARFLLHEGERALARESAMSAGLAVSLFQDAAVLMIWAIAKSLDANLRDQAPFDSFWDAVATAPKNAERLELPSRAALRELNKARVNFKHYGQLPLPEDATRFRTATDVFLRETAERFLKVDLESYSLADLLHNQAARNKIKEAEQLFKEERWQDCVEACALAERAAAKDFEGIIPEPDPHLEDVGILIDGRSSSSNGRRAFRYLREYLNALRSVSIQGLTGRNVKHFAWFKSIAPTVLEFKSGNVQFTYSSRGLGRKAGRAEAEFCIKYVTDFALQAQERLAG